MASVRYIVNSALRKIGRLGAGREPRVADQSDVLAAFSGLFPAWVAAGTFGRLNDVVPSGDSYVASGNERIYRRDGEKLVVTLPEMVSEDSYADYGMGARQGYYGTKITIEESGGDTIITVEASQPIGRATMPRDGSVVVITDAVGGNTRHWLYDGTIKRWQSLDILQLDDEAPRSTADPEGLSAMLAMEIADTFGAEVGPTALRQAARFEGALIQRFGMRREPVPGVYC